MDYADKLDMMDDDCDIQGFPLEEQVKDPAVQKVSLDDMSLKELDDLAEQLGIESCSYCKYSDDCPRGVRCYGGAPIFPICAENEPQYWVDEDELINLIEEKQKENVEDE
jgi:hypothetical protein